MKLTILKDDLNESINHVAKATSSKSPIPILSGIKMELNASGLTLTASDTDITIQSFIPILKEGKEVIRLVNPGGVVIPAKFFIEIVRKLPDDNVEIEVNEHFTTLIRSGSSEIQLVGMDPEEFPVLPRIDEKKCVVMDGLLLKTMVRQTGFAVSINEATPILTGVLLTVKDKSFKLTATDRHRLAFRDVDIDCDDELQIYNTVIPGKTLNELNKIIPDQSQMIDIVSSDNQILFRMNSVLFYSRILDGNYPETSKIIPQSFKTELVINTRKLMDAIDRAYLLSREDKSNIVKLTTSEDRSIEISSSSSELGKVTEQIELAEFAGERELKISFNSKYMLDVLKTIDSELVYIGFTGAMSPIIVKPKSDIRMLHLILPYRTTN